MTPRRPRGHATPRDPADLSPRGLSACNAMISTPRMIRPRGTATRGVQVIARHTLTPRGWGAVHPRSVSVYAATTSTPRLFTPLKGGPAESRGVPLGERVCADLSQSGRLTSPQLLHPSQPGAGGYEIDAAHPGGRVRVSGAVRTLPKAGSEPMVLRERNLSHAKSEGVPAQDAGCPIYRYARGCFVVKASMLREAQKVEFCPVLVPGDCRASLNTESPTALRAIALCDRSGGYDR